MTAQLDGVPLWLKILAVVFLCWTGFIIFAAVWYGWRVERAKRHGMPPDDILFFVFF